MKPPVTWVALLALALTACAGGNVSTQSSDTGSAAAAAEQVLTAAPEGSRWKLVESSIAGLDGAAATAVRVAFVGQTLSGDSSCNRFSAPLDFVGGQIKLGAPMSTKRACLDGRSEVEQALYAALPGLVRAVRVGERLRLEHADGGYLLFDADPVVAE